VDGALLDLASVMNRPKGDEMMVREAGIPRDRALFAILVGSSAVARSVLSISPTGSGATAPRSAARSRSRRV
jgi:hypothetical protein